MRIHADDLLVGRIRELQALYPNAHSALVNWGRWGRDRAGIFPPGPTAPKWVDQIVASKFGDWADEQAGPPSDGLEAKAERAERQPYDERAAVELDLLIHREFSERLRRVLGATYVTREVREDQFPALAGCENEVYLVRLRVALNWVNEPRIMRNCDPSDADSKSE